MEQTNYMQELIISCYQNVAIEALQHGFDGSLERLIAKQLQLDYRRCHSQAVEIVDSCYTSGEKANACFLKAAYLITSSKIPENV